MPAAHRPRSASQRCARLPPRVPAKGSVEVNGVALNARDCAAISEEPAVKVHALEDTELVLVNAA